MRVPKRLIERARAPEDILVYCAIQKKANLRGLVCITREDLSKELGLGLRRLAGAINRLISEGLIYISRRYYLIPDKEVLGRRYCYRIAGHEDYLKIPDGIVLLPYSAQEKGLLIYLWCISGDDGATFTGEGDILSQFRRRPVSAMRQLGTRGLLMRDRFGIVLNKKRLLMLMK